jgi:hypothetical protein
VDMLLEDKYLPQFLKVVNQRAPCDLRDDDLGICLQEKLTHTRHRHYRSRIQTAITSVVSVWDSIARKVNLKTAHEWNIAEDDKLRLQLSEKVKALMKVHKIK